MESPSSLAEQCERYVYFSCISVVFASNINTHSISSELHVTHYDDLSPSTCLCLRDSSQCMMRSVYRSLSDQGLRCFLRLSIKIKSS